MVLAALQIVPLIFAWAFLFEAVANLAGFYRRAGRGPLAPHEAAALNMVLVQLVLAVAAIVVITGGR